MKYFSLLSGQEVHPAPDQNVIPASEFAMMQQASEILAAAQREAEKFKREVAEEAEKTRELAFQEGFQDGLVSLNEHLLLLEQALKELREEVHKKVLPVALKAARKIIGEELKLHPDRIVDIVMTSLKSVTQHRKVTIYANRTDLEHLEFAKPKIKQMFEKLENFSLQERDDIEPGGCIIETEAGIINAQLENQWRAIELAFETFTKK